MKKKILLISHDLSVTGAPMSLFGIAKILQNNGIEVSVLSLKEGPLAEIYKNNLNINVKILNKDIQEDVIALIDTLSKFDFVIVNTVVCDFMANICEEMNIPYIWIIRESQNIKVFVRKWAFTYKCLKKCQKNIYVVSEYVQKYIKDEFGFNVKVIHNFVDDEYQNVELSSHNGPLNFLVLGTIEKRKGIHVLIDAFLPLEEKYRNLFNLNIVGEYSKGYKPYSEPLMNKTANYNNIKWCGVLTGESRKKIFENTDVFIVPSLDESSSRVVLEACMMGRPVIVTKNVGAKYMVNEHTGWIVKTEDSESLKNCIENILTNPQILPEMGKEARKMYLKTSTPEIYKSNLDKILLNLSPNNTSKLFHISTFKLFSLHYLKNCKITYICGFKIKQNYNNKKNKAFIKNIFSVQNTGIHKKITILGVQIKVKTRKLQEKEKERERERNIQANFDKLNNHIKKLENKLIAQAVAQNEAKKDFEYKLCKYMPEVKYPEYLKDWLYKVTGETLNLDNPQTFNEKIQWMKLYDSTPLKTRLADKYLVRDWVKEKIGDEYLIPLLGVWDKFDDIDFDKLPDKFVLKANHGCAWNIIVTDKNKFDKEDAKQKFSLWLNKNFAYCFGLELHYKSIKPLIIAEEYIENDNQDLYDYKIWCFDGKAKYIQFLSERKEGLKMVFYDTEWNKQDFVYSYPRNEKDIEKPKNLELLLTLAEKLAQGFSHVRVDFYILNDGSIKFGEMTFTSMSGACKWVPNDTNKVMGDLIAINKE